MCAKIMEKNTCRVEAHKLPNNMQQELTCTIWNVPGAK